MKLATFDRKGQLGIGIVVDQQVYPIEGAGMPSSMLELIQGGDKLWQKVKAEFQAGKNKAFPASEAKIKAPISKPGKIMAIGHNYMDHIREQNAPVPAYPIVFAKYSTSIIGPDEAITWDESLTQQVDIEAELCVVIGKTARRVAEDKALDFVFGYTALNDVSARDLQYGDKQWVRGKSLDTFCPLGPAIVTADEVPDPQTLHLSSKINDFVMQDSSTKEMIFSVRYLIAFLSRAFTLEPGDLIATGTPNGVGNYRNPKIFIKNGDVITIEVEMIGTLANPARMVRSEA